MTCNNALATQRLDGGYSFILPPDKLQEKNAVLKEAIEKHSGYFHIEISRVRKPKSIQQNKLFHALITEYYISGLHSCPSWQALKNQMKYQFGEGFIQTLTLADGEKYGILKSLADYSMSELSRLTDNVISDMIQVGVNSKKFDEILKEIGK